MSRDMDTSTHPLSPAAIRLLESGLQGEIVRPGDDAYDRRRRVWNTAVDRHPALIVRARAPSDVQRVVELARTMDVPLAVRSGGHSPAGYGTVDDGIVLDLASMKRFAVDAHQRVAQVEPGLTWGEYNLVAHAHGLATPGGDVGSVGVGGLALSGGMGWLMRRFGMTIDNLLAADVVTADGQLLTAGGREHPDLFWGLRGGGGNLGVATRLIFRLHPVDTVLGGAIVHPATRDALRAYADAAMHAPDELTTITFVQPAPPLPFIPPEVHGTPVHAIIPCFVGDPVAGERALAPFRSLTGGAPIADTVGPMPYPGLFDLSEMAGTSRPHAIRNGFVRDLTDEVIDTMLEFVGRATSPFSVIALRELGGAMARVDRDETAFAHRDKAFYVAGDNGWDDGDADRHLAWTEDLWQALAPHTDGAYAGFLGDEGDARVREAYPPATYERLAAAKRRYDPDNLFRANANVPSA
jgi:FAD/FMN-containing dehydrogenase